MAFTSELVAGESIVGHRALFSSDGRCVFSLALTFLILTRCRLLLVPSGSGSGVAGFSTETGERVVEMHHHTDTVTAIALGGKNKLQVKSYYSP